MKRLRFITVALAAALAISAVAVASASAALPEWRKGGEALKVKVKFEATSETGTLETVGKKKVTCTSDKAEGEIEASKAAVKVFVTYKGCKDSTGAECKTAGAAKEEIKTNELSGNLIYIDEAKTKVGLLLKSNAVGKDFATFVCFGFVTVHVTGEVIGQAKPLNVEQETGELIYKQTLGVQEFKTENGAGNKHLNTKIGFGEEEESAIQSTEAVKWLPAGTKVEIKA